MVNSLGSAGTRLSTCLLVSVLALAACSGEPDPPPPDGIIEYVALGDSYTAAPRTPDTGLSVPCFRSDENYPHLVADRLPDVRLTDVSCSGATSAAMTEEQSSRGHPVPPQLDALSEEAELVTVGIGGNDENLFLSWFVQCAQLAPTDPRGSPCADENRTPDGDRLLDLVPTIEDNVRAILRKVKKRAPSAQVIAVTYPRVFPAGGTCDLAAAYAVGDHAYINRIVQALSDAIEAAAKDVGVDWVDVYGASRGHDVCSDEPWVNGVTEDQTLANVLHPLPTEQAAVARMILEKL